MVKVNKMVMVNNIPKILVNITDSGVISDYLTYFIYLLPFLIANFFSFF
jgi:hypothetical protein